MEGWWKESNSYTIILELTSIYTDRLYTVHMYIKLTIFAVVTQTSLTTEKTIARRATCLHLRFKNNNNNFKSTPSLVTNQT